MRIVEIRLGINGGPMRIIAYSRKRMAHVERIGWNTAQGAARWVPYLRAHKRNRYSLRVGSEFRMAVAV